MSSHGSVTGEGEERRSSSQSKLSPTETIKFNEAEGSDGFLIRHDTTLVNIFPSRNDQKVKNSSKVKLTQLVDYTWEAQPGVGKAVAVHYSGDFVAYSVKISAAGAVRILNLKTNDRVLIKGMRGLIRDIDFMHKADDLIIGIIDEYGHFYVYKIMKTKFDAVEPFKVLKVEIDGAPARNDNRRFIWCKFVPDESDEKKVSPDKDYAFHFAVCQDDKVYVSNLLRLVRKYGEADHTFSAIKSSFLIIDTHSDSVVDASFSPDGTALCTASKDGTVKFFQFYIEANESTVRCLYSWNPHPGNPVSRIFFLDDHTLNTDSSDAQYWKYIITAGPKMTELKLWTCEQWQCIQTINFSPPPSSSLKMELNISASFLIVSDSQRKALYTINITHNENEARFSHINEFTMPVTVLGFSIGNAEICTIKKMIDRGLVDFVPDADATDENCILDIVFVQPKSLMQGVIIYTPPSAPFMNGRSHSRISFDDSVNFKDEADDDDELDGDDKCDQIEAEVENEEEEEIEDMLEARTSSKSLNNALSPHSLIPSRSLSKSPPPPHHNDKSPLRASSPSPLPLNSLVGSGIPPGSVNSLTQQLSSLIGVTGRSGSRGQRGGEEEGGSLGDHYGTIETQRVRSSSGNGNVSNASSSPSREVEEILSPKNAEFTSLKGFVPSQHQHLKSDYTVNNLDIEGNIIDMNLSHKMDFGSTKIPTKTKSLGGGELGQQLPEVLEQVTSIMDMMKAQAIEMRELKREVSRLNNVQTTSMKNYGDEALIARTMEKYTLINESALRRVEESIKVSVMSMERQPLPACFTENLSKVIVLAIKNEIENHCVPLLLKSFEPVHKNLNTEIDKLIRGSEHKIKQQISQLIAGHDFKSSLTKLMSESVRTTCEGVLTNLFANTICPNFEKSIQNLFTNVNESFIKGTREYLSELETSASSRSKSESDGLRDFLKKELGSVQDALSSILQVELETTVRPLLTGLSSSLGQTLEEGIGRQIERSFGETQRLLEASVRAVTPAPSLCSTTDHYSSSMSTLDPAVVLSQLVAMLNSKEIVPAFTKAASIGDSNILMTLAQKVDPKLVFTPELSSVALLSIIQQMISDISTHTQLKIEYLQVAISNLNASDPKIQKGLSRLIPVFQTNVCRYITANPESPLNNGLKVLEMAFSSIGAVARMQQHSLTPLYQR